MTAPTRVATFTSRLTNPCALSLGFLLLAATASRDAGSAAATIAAALFLSAMPAGYVRARLSGGRIRPRALEGMTEYLRHHPRGIIALSLAGGLPVTAALAVARAPLFAVVAVAVLTATALLLALVNLRYRASYHVAAVTSLALMAMAIWEAAFPVALAIVPLVGWARYRLGDHTILQLSVGCGVATAVSAAAFGILTMAGLWPA